MGFFDIGPLEIVLILVVILIIWGPGKIPEVARTIGKIIYSLRKGTSELTSTITRELNIEEKTPVKQAQTATKAQLPDSGASKPASDTVQTAPPAEEQTKQGGTAQVNQHDEH